MTRLLCLSDTQLGVGTVDLIDQGIVLDRIVAVALDRKADLVVHAGDLFEGPVITPEQLRVFLDATEPLRIAGIPVLITLGNGRHDLAVRSVHALDVFREVTGFHVADRPGVYRFGDLAVCALPWVHPGQLIARMNGSIDHDLVNAAAGDLLVRIAGDLARAAESEQKVLVAHWAISGAKLPSGLPVEEMREPVLPWAELDALGYDAIIAGHIHESQRLDNPDLDLTVGVVVGSPQQLNFGERGDHGCWQIDVDRGATAEFIPIESRRFVTLDFDHEDPLAQIALSDRLGWEVAEGAIIRLRACLTSEQAQRLDQAALRRSLMEAGAHSVRLDITVERDRRARIEVSEQVSAVEAMRLFCEANQIGDPLRAKLLETVKAWSEE